MARSSLKLLLQLIAIAIVNRCRDYAKPVAGTKTELIFMRLTLPSIMSRNRSWNRFMPSRCYVTRLGKRRENAWLKFVVICISWTKP